MTRDRQAHRVQGQAGSTISAPRFRSAANGGGRSDRHGSAASILGAAYVFIEPASGVGEHDQAAKLTASDGTTYDRFGNSVSISENGDTVVVGATYRWTDPALPRGGLRIHEPAPVVGRPRAGHEVHRVRRRGGRRFRPLGLD